MSLISFNVRNAKKQMKYTPEMFFKDDGNIEAYFNNMGVYKVTVIPQGNSLGHTAMMPEADILSQNKQDLLSFIGKNSNNMALYLFLFNHIRLFYYY